MLKIAKNLQNAVFRQKIWKFEKYFIILQPDHRKWQKVAISMKNFIFYTRVPPRLLQRLSNASLTPL